MVRCFGAIGVIADLLGEQQWRKEDEGEGQGEYARGMDVEIHGAGRRCRHVGQAMLSSRRTL